jgi:biotin carboxyl carrier protein
MISFVAFGRSLKRSTGRARHRRHHAAWLAAVMLATASPQPSRAADDAPANGAAVTVLKATRSCFSDVVDVFGILRPKEEIAVRPDRPGLKVAEVMVDAGQTVTAGQTLARLSPPEGGSILVQAPVAGMVGASSAVVGAVASGKGEALFSIITGNEFDLVAQVPTRDLAEHVTRPHEIQRQPRSIGRAGFDPDLAASYSEQRVATIAFLEQHFAACELLGLTEV